MEMTIDEAIGVSETCQYILSNQVGSSWCKSKYDAVTIAISTMRKYQKIEKILNKDLNDYHPLDRNPIRLSLIREVVKDEKID